MRILIVHRYYWPDAGAYSAMLHIMAKKFVEDGHQVTVFSTQPGYNNVTDERLPRRTESDGIEIYRVGLLKEDKKKFLNRAFNVILFVLQLVWHFVSRFGRYDLVTVASFPPTVTAMVVRWMTWLTGGRYLYHCQDIYPEIAEASGLIKRKWLANLALSIDRRSCKRALAIVSLSNDMQKTLVDRGVSDGNMHVINNFIIDKFDPTITVDSNLQKVDGKFRVLFAGNMGRFQNLDKLMLAAEKFRRNPDVQFFFVGAGAMESELRQQAKDLGLMESTVFFRPFQPLSKVMKVIHDADLSIISLSPGVIDCAYPSKTMSYVEAGCRSLAILEPDSELADLIRSKDLGEVCRTPTAAGIAAAIENEYQRWKESDYDRERIRKIGNEIFGQGNDLERMVPVVEATGERDWVEIGSHPMSSNVRFPDFLCIGSPKCGSSWLHELLDSHPHVFIPSELKEIHFFDEKFERGLDWYAQFFEARGPEHRLAGEITPHYLYGDPNRIKQCTAVEKLIIIYRDPVERCVSHYKFRIRLDNYNGSFEKFLDDYPESIEWSLYGKHFRRFLEVFDRPQFLVLSFEQATLDIGQTKKRLATFLGLDDSMFPDNAGKSTVNQAFRPKNPAMYKMAIRAAKWMGDRGLYRLRNWLKQNPLTQKLLSKPTESFEIQIAAQTRAKLEAQFVEDQKLFQELILFDRKTRRDG